MSASLDSGHGMRRQLAPCGVSAGQVHGVVGGRGMFDTLWVSTDALSGFAMAPIDLDS